MNQVDPHATAILIDSDSPLRGRLREWLLGAGVPVETFDSGAQMLAGEIEQRPGCVLTNVQLSDASGLEVQAHLNNKGSLLPVIFVAQEPTVDQCVRAFHGGAFDFFTTPLDANRLLARVAKAFEKNARLRELAAQQHEIRARFEMLTPREREVMALLIAGKQTKRIAADMGISLQTVAKHRASILGKMDQVRTPVTMMLCRDFNVSRISPLTIAATDPP